MKHWAQLALLAAVSSGFAAEVADVTGVREFRHPDLGLTVISGEVRLPVNGLWYVLPVQGRDASVQQVQLVPPAEVTQRLLGVRGRSVEERRQSRRGRGPLRQIHRAFTEYAREERVASRMTLADLDPVRLERVQQALDRNPFSEALQSVAPPFYFLIRDVVLEFPELEDGEKRAPNRRPQNDDLLAFELHPFLDDGKHWVLLANGSTERVTIDPELAATYDIAVTPVLSSEPETVADGMASYRAFGLLRQGQRGGDAVVAMQNWVTGEETNCRWPLGEMVPGDTGILAEWARARANRWQGVVQLTDASVLNTWLSRHQALYGTAGALPRRRRRRRERTTNAFNVLGGRAAMRETLQMQLLRDQAEADTDAAAVPVAEIPGVEVKSHPFEEMLAGQPGGSLALADSVPLDHFFVYVRQPQALLPFLEDGADLIFRLGATSLGTSTHHDVTTRYIHRLGMSREWLRLVLKSGLVNEMAVVTPDLFLIDGTDVTALVQLPQVGLMKRFLGLLGVRDLAEAVITECDTKAGSTAYWSISGDLLLVSTNRSELQHVLDVRRGTGPPSLGRSAEFRYMLTQLPVSGASRMYLYFSDPFIRHLVGPAAKIGQLRRMKAKADMEALIAGALLRQLDGYPDTASADLLARLGYVPAHMAKQDYVLHADLTVTSATYGSAHDLSTLAQRPAEFATPAEAAAYKEYVASYRRFWRRYFDPIAIRLDDTDDAGLELTTFILPLLDNRMYEGLREVLGDAANSAPLRMPRLSAEPVMMLSLNISDRAWVHVVEGLRDALRRFAGFDQRLFDELGPSVHLAVQDSDPVIALGSGDLLGALGGGGRPFGGRLEMFGIPLMLSILTRPCTLFVELHDANRVTDILRRTASRSVSGEFDDEVRGAFYQLKDHDAWMYALDLFGMVKLRFGMEVRDGYLVVKNLPWSQDAAIVRTDAAELSGARLELRPDAVEAQLPALFTAAADQQRKAAMSGIGDLLPMMLTGCESVDAAVARHRLLFGYAPRHPGAGKWLWQDGRLESTVFGSTRRQQQPPHRPGDRAFGLLQGIEYVTLDMQLEDTGLRSALRWKLADDRRVP